MSNIEEDIKILEDKDCLVNYPELQVLEATKHLLAEREVDKKRIKELEEELVNKENKIWKLKETIQDLENECISLHELIDEEM